MDRQTADEVLACLVGERTLYHYYRDRYSIGLLRHLSRRQALRIAALKQSPYAQLLQKPRVRNILANSGGKEIIDLDWQTGTALIEEIQSDWIRRVAWLGERVAGRLKSGQQPADETRYCGLKCLLQTTQEYCRFALGRYAAIWATIAFVREELGLQRIYYHSEESGRLLKNIRGKLPPRSLYTDLPRKFCFVPTPETPEFLLRASGVGKAIRRREGLSFFQLTTSLPLPSPLPRREMTRD